MAEEGKPSLPAITQPGVKSSDEPKFERIERTQQLVPGRYWRASKKAKDADGQVVPAGTVLLLRRIKRVDDAPHSVELHPHPLSGSNPHPFLLKAFLAAFVPEDRGAEIRQEEMAAVHLEINAQQRELIEFQSNPMRTMDLLRQNPALAAPARNQRSRGDRELDLDDDAKLDIEAGLPSASINQSMSMVSMVTEHNPALLRRQLNNQAIVARARAEHITSLSETIAETVGRLTPFYQEQAAVAIAMTEDALDLYRKVKNGLETLGLYTGEGVELIKVRSGNQADPAEPMRIMQQVLFMDEESLISVHDGGAQFDNYADFIALIKKDDALLTRIAPFERTMAAMQFTRERKHIEGADVRLQAARDEENAKIFFLVRNGDFLHAIRCSVERMTRLFPTDNEIDGSFREHKWFNGIESDDVSVEDFQRIDEDDIRYSDSKAHHDALVQHYRKILVLIAGLIDREPAVVGEFPALAHSGGFGILSIGGQNACLDFISDEGRALAEDRPAFTEWVRQKNKLLSSGSRVLCYWRNLMTPATAPAAVVYEPGSRSERHCFKYQPDNISGVTIAYRDGQAIKVDAPVSGTVYDREGSRERSFHATVDVTRFENDSWRDLGYLVLDGVTIDEVNHYIYTRAGRSEYMRYAGLLFEARQHLSSDAKHEATLRAKLAAASIEAKVADEQQITRIVSDVIRQWRSAHRGRATPIEGEDDFRREVQSMMDQLWRLCGHGQDRKAEAERIGTEQGRPPLRLALTGKGQLVLYCEPRPQEQETLLGHAPWVKRVVLSELKTKITPASESWALLSEIDPRETVLARWEREGQWIGKKAPAGLKVSQVQSLRSMGAEARRMCVEWLTPATDEQFASLLHLAQAEYRRLSGRFVKHGHLFIPAALIATGKNEATFEHHILGYLANLPQLLYSVGNLDQRNQVKNWMRSIYKHPTKHIEALDCATGGVFGFAAAHLGKYLANNTKRRELFDESWRLFQNAGLITLSECLKKINGRSSQHFGCGPTTVIMKFADIEPLISSAEKRRARIFHSKSDHDEDEKNKSRQVKP